VPPHLFRSSSMAEHSAVNRGVVGSSPTCGAISLVSIVDKAVTSHGLSPQRLIMIILGAVRRIDIAEVGVQVLTSLPFPQ
jgi:hypothetical protein